MPSANPTPHPLDAAARDELARKAEAARDADAEFNACPWYGAEARNLAFAALNRVATPDVILALLAAVERGEADTANVTRFEVIDHRPEYPNHPINWRRGRVFVANPCRVELSYQDDGRTLKVFVDDAARAHPPIQETDDDA